MTAPDGPDRAEIRALLRLEATPGVGLATLRSLVEAFGSGRAAVRARPAALREATGRRVRIGPEGGAVDRAVGAGLAAADRAGMETLSWTSPDYPRMLLRLHDPPPVLFLRGDTRLLDAGRGVAVVGARRATSRARSVSERLGRALAHAGLCSVSGMALGVDGSVHAGALAAGGGTIAVLGTGADLAYPRAHRRLFRDIVAHGLAVSEFMPGTPALAHHFPRRNRILAALSACVVVVEAGPRSGALITVDHALDLGIDVWAVPGPIDGAACLGSNALLDDGARPLTSVEGFVAALEGRSGPRRPAAPSVEVTGVAGALLGALRGGVLGVDELVAEAGLPAGEVLAQLTELESRGLVHPMPGMRYGATEPRGVGRARP